MSHNKSMCRLYYTASSEAKTPSGQKKSKNPTQSPPLKAKSLRPCPKGMIWNKAAEVGTKHRSGLDPKPKPKSTKPRGRPPREWNGMRRVKSGCSLKKKKKDDDQSRPGEVRIR